MTYTKSTPETLTPNEARAGRKTTYMPKVLGLSTVGAAILCLIVFALFAS